MASKKRCVVEMSDDLAQRLKEKADQLDMPVSGAVKLAIHTLLELSDELIDGSSVVVQKRDGKETRLFVPQLSPPRAAF